MTPLTLVRNLLAHWKRSHEDQEISSTSEQEVKEHIDPELMEPDCEPGHLICVPPERHPDPNIQEIVQKDYLRKLAIKICENARLNSMAYQGSQEHQTISIHVCTVVAQFRADPNIGMTTMRSNILKNPIVLPGMDYIFAASLLFEYILSEYDYNLVFFTPRSNMISVGFPTRRISTDVFGYDSTKPETEQMLQRWMSHVSNVRHIHIGNIETVEQENRCAAIYEQYFEGRIEGVQGDNVSKALCETFRIMHPSLAYHSDSISMKLVINWIMGWINNKETYKHLTEVRFSSRSEEFNYSNFFKWLSIDESSLPARNRLQMQTPDKRQCCVYVHDTGEIQFFTGGDYELMTYNKHPFGPDGLTDINVLYKRYVMMDHYDSECTNFYEY
ncbi:hypothetical protein CRE_01145 [Caenorhabditis remanei]|uniref:Uncharacterized protein n=1 Tax=Caenorhabditis remanei TaxID=31234 RepID=E3MWF1_CAERE|nr:hypothetical protein CRE_01145 [Caenorhabditis remanei]